MKKNWYRYSKYIVIKKKKKTESVLEYMNKSLIYYKLINSKDEQKLNKHLTDNVSRDGKSKEM